MIDWGGLIDGARLYFVVFARVAALLRTAPLTSSSGIPPMARGALIFFVAIIFYYFVGESYGPLPETGLAYAMILLAEIMLGVIMGLFFRSFSPSSRRQDSCFPCRWVSGHPRYSILWHRLRFP